MVLKRSRSDVLRVLYKFLDLEARRTIRMIATPVTISATKLILLDFTVALRPDERAYKASWRQTDSVFHILPRGLCLIFEDTKDFSARLLNTVVKKRLGVIIEEYAKERGSTLNFVHAASGLPKFGDDPSLWRMQCPHRPTSHVFMEKENGECFHMAAFRLHGKLFAVIGSKNVHMVVPGTVPSDVSQYEGTRFTFAREFCESLASTVGQALSATLDFLAKTEQTLCGESCDPEHQHIVHYATHNVYFYAFTTYPALSSPSFCSEPMAAIEKIKELGLKPVRYVREIKLTGADWRAEEEALRDEIAQRQQSEGCVLYEVCGDCVAQLRKVKSYAYVFDRAVREKIRGGANELQLLERLKRLHVKEDNFEQRKAEAVRFLRWVRAGNATSIELREHYVDVLHRFSQLPLDQQTVTIPKRKHVTPRAVLFVGMPGSGKSTLSKVVERVSQSVRVNQDECGGKAKRFHAEIARVPASSIVLLDKCLHNDHIRANAIRAIGDRPYCYVVLGDGSDCPTESLSSECEKRIRVRGDAHLTLRPSSQLSGILDGFKASFEPVMDSAAVFTENIDVRRPLLEVAEDVCDLLSRHGLEIDTDGVPSAVEAVLEEEKAARRAPPKAQAVNTRPPLYYAAVLGEEAVAKVKEASECLFSTRSFNARSGDPLDKTSDFHATLVFKPRKKADRALRTRLDEVVDIHVTELLASDTHVVARVKLDPELVKFHDSRPHITLGVADGHKPVDSKLLLDHADEKLEVDFVVKGKVVAIR